MCRRVGKGDKRPIHENNGRSLEVLPVHGRDYGLIRVY